MPNEYIKILGAREHNLKNISVNIPKNKLIAITGPSGSGKSTLAMDILQRECQRQYMDSMGIVTDGFNKPKVDSITGLSPAIGISQSGISGANRSTVGTYTEILTYLRILYAKVGTRICPSCQNSIEPDHSMNDEVELDKEKVVCPKCKTKLNVLTMANFSFNKPEGACKVCSGTGNVTEIDLSKIVNEELTVSEGANTLLSAEMYGEYYAGVLRKCGKHYGFDFDTSKKVKDFNALERLVFYHGVDSEEFKVMFPDIKKPKRVNDGYFKGVATFMKEKAAENDRKKKKNSKITSSFIIDTCPECKGTRLNLEGRTVTVNNKTIPEVSQYDMKGLLNWLENLKLSKQEEIIIEAVIFDLKKRIGNIIKIGLGYLSIDRGINTLSGGEAQRIKLSNIIDSGLTGVLYVLDEPTVGLHPRDVHRLLDALKHLRDLGNTVLVIEHDADFINACDHIIDFGPSAGRFGGEIMATGTPFEIIENNDSITGKYLVRKSGNIVRQKKGFEHLQVSNAYAHNLKNIDVKVPLNSFVCFTGVSGSGKSSLVFDVINKFYEKGKAECDGVTGYEKISKVVTIDQKPIGRMSRSNVATYTEVYTLIRELFSELTDAKKLRLKPSHFSFNVKGGRCEKCQGLGMISLDMQFLDNVEVECPVCKGHRFKKKILGIKHNGKSISDILNMTVEENIEYFKFQDGIRKRLENLKEVGLGYLKLGQSTVTLSGGECQRIKLSKELGRTDDNNILYILDEPTTGLHPGDIEKILDLLYKLKSKGNSIIVIEHSLEVIVNSEFIIDLGYNGGYEGGEIIAAGNVREIMENKNSYTGQYIKKFLAMK